MAHPMSSPGQPSRPLPWTAPDRADAFAEAIKGLETYKQRDASKAPDDTVANLFKSFSTDGHLIVNYSCQHCQESFCQEHFKVAAHKCPKYDESKYNRVAPDCPFCNTPVAVRPGQDPNDRMEDHITQECSVMSGKSGRTKATPKCTKAFCATHRFASDHDCNPIPAAAPASRPKVADLFNSNVKNLNAKASASGVAAVDAVKKAAASAKVLSQGSKSQPTPAKPSTPSSHSNPFSKTDRRAKAERESKLRAMQARAKKGLLSDEEKAILAAEEKAATERKDDCVVM
ncbi:hypothetical protein H0H93_012766 [Arthromyces matolae]|nr:hypothetical protein H0H93_012766 [Arthromyces matolae]